MNELRWNDFGNIKTIEGLEEYFCNRDITHTYYFHYTSLTAVNKILESNRLRLSCVNKFNDLKERESITNNSNKYALCFSTGVNENLPLWYLYSGISGKGARLKITKTQYKRMINDVTLYLTSYHEGNKVDEIKLEEDDYHFVHRDVLYLKSDDNKVAAKYNTMTNYNLTSEELKRYASSYNGFTKSIIWFYEKETRLLVELFEEGLKRKSELINGDSYYVELDISNIRKNIHIDLAPEVLIDEVVNNENFVFINEFLYSTSKVQSSEYVGQVKMDLFKQNLSFIEGECLNSVDSDDERKVINEVFDRMRKK